MVKVVVMRNFEKKCIRLEEAVVKKEEKGPIISVKFEPSLSI